MRYSLALLALLTLCATSPACGSDNAITAPSSTPTPLTVTFNGLSDRSCNGLFPLSPHCAVRSYIESGITVSAISGDWLVRNDYGSPAPFIQFVAAPGVTGTGELRVTARDATFSFASVDLYSSTTSIPYKISGLRNLATVFTLSDTLPNTFGNFVTVTNPGSPEAIDALSIVLTNPAAQCCRNPAGIDALTLVQ